MSTVKLVFVKKITKKQMENVIGVIIWGENATYNVLKIPFRMMKILTVLKNNLKLLDN